MSSQFVFLIENLNLIEGLLAPDHRAVKSGVIFPLIEVVVV